MEKNGSAESMRTKRKSNSFGDNRSSKRRRGGNKIVAERIKNDESNDPARDIDKFLDEKKNLVIVNNERKIIIVSTVQREENGVYILSHDDISLILTTRKKYLSCVLPRSLNDEMLRLKFYHLDDSARFFFDVTLCDRNISSRINSNLHKNCAPCDRRLCDHFMDIVTFLKRIINELM